MEPVVSLEQWRVAHERGGVYFILEEDSDWVKIGFAGADRPKGTQGGYQTGIGARFSSMQVGNPHRLVLYAFLPATRTQERRVHELFADRRGIGEWFNLPGFTSYADARYLVELLEDAQSPAQGRLFHIG